MKRLYLCVSLRNTRHCLCPSTYYRFPFLSRVLLLYAAQETRQRGTEHNHEWLQAVKPLSALSGSAAGPHTVVTISPTLYFMFQSKAPANDFLDSYYQYYFDY